MPCCARAYFPALVRPRGGEDQRSVEVPGNCVMFLLSPQGNKTIKLAMRRRRSSDHRRLSVSFSFGEDSSTSQSKPQGLPPVMRSKGSRITRSERLAATFTPPVLKISLLPGFNAFYKARCIAAFPGLGRRRTTLSGSASTKPDRPMKLGMSGSRLLHHASARQDYATFDAK